MKKLFYFAVWALLTIGSVPTANAATLTWTLQDVVFDDGGTATGSFGYDVDINTFSAINITTSVNASLGLGTTYGIPTVAGSSSIFDTFLGSPPSGKPRFSIYLKAAMTNLGGTIGGFFGETLCPDNTCGVRFLRSTREGSITASPVPLPAALPLFAAGLGAMGFMGWRRKRKATA